MGGLLEGLNERQRVAVEAPQTPMCIRAGAGTGKTRVLTRRIAFQAEVGAIDPSRTLALTFTRKAGNELRERLARLGLRASVSAGTIHRAAFAQLRARWADLGVRPPELVQNKKGLLARVAHLSKMRLPEAELAEAVTEIDWAKARGIAPDAYAEEAERVRRQITLDPATIGDLYQRYEEEKTKRRLVDFDDLLILARQHLTEDPDYAEARRWKFQHLFVDEFQDVNQIQFDLIRAWLGDRNDLCAVGDPNQAIYTWNGANSDYIERFSHWFPNAEVFDLLDNYRSSPQILAAGRAVLPAGAASLISHQPDGPVPTITAHADANDEAEGIAQALRDAKGPETAWSSMAVLARTNAQAATLADALRKAKIPCRVRTDLRRYERENSEGAPIDTDAVDVATFHAAKGLEWNIVHLAGLEQGLVPIYWAKTPAEYAEEQRLLYVAITRAQLQLHCHLAVKRNYGIRPKPRMPSPFLQDILNASAAPRSRKTRGRRG